MVDFFSMMFNAAEFLKHCAHAKIICYITEHNKHTIISIGRNQYKTHPFQKRFAKNEDCIYLHAEIDAIKNALKSLHSDDLERCDLYVMRLKKASRIGPVITGLSKPCEGCMRAIATFGIRNVYYTEENKKEFTCL